MQAVSLKAARRNLKGLLGRVCSDRDPLIITRNRGEAVVVVPLSHYASLKETAHLLRSPANARRLLDAISELDPGA